MHVLRAFYLINDHCRWMIIINWKMNSSKQAHEKLSHSFVVWPTTPLLILFDRDNYYFKCIRRVMN